MNVQSNTTTSVAVKPQDRVIGNMYLWVQNIFTKPCLNKTYDIIWTIENLLPGGPEAWRQDWNWGWDSKKEIVRFISGDVNWLLSGGKWIGRWQCQGGHEGDWSGRASTDCSGGSSLYTQDTLQASIMFTHSHICCSLMNASSSPRMEPLSCNVSIVKFPVKLKFSSNSRTKLRNGSWHCWRCTSFHGTPDLVGTRNTDLFLLKLAWGVTWVWRQRTWAVTFSLTVIFVSPWLARPPWYEVQEQVEHPANVTCNCSNPPHSYTATATASHIEKMRSTATWGNTQGNTQQHPKKLPRWQTVL